MLSRVVVLQLYNSGKVVPMLLAADSGMKLRVLCAALTLAEDVELYRRRGIRA